MESVNLGESASPTCPSYLVQACTGLANFTARPTQDHSQTFPSVHVPNYDVNPPYTPLFSQKEITTLFCLPPLNPFMFSKILQLLKIVQFCFLLLPSKHCLYHDPFDHLTLHPCWVLHCGANLGELTLERNLQPVPPFTIPAVSMFNKLAIIKTCTIYFFLDGI